ncbi:hypothetical protein AKJ16_DCAP20857 [Drosera capensis]
MAVAQTHTKQSPSLHHNTLYFSKTLISPPAAPPQIDGKHPRRRTVRRLCSAFHRPQTIFPRAKT